MGTAKARETFTGTDRYQVEEPIGSGGMGVVYRAKDLVRGTVVALKTLEHVSPATILQLKEEFRAIAEFSHPNVVVCHELVRNGQDWFFTMDLVDGTPFVMHVWEPSTSRPPLPSARAAETTMAAETLFLSVDPATDDHAETVQRSLPPRPPESISSVIPLVPAKRTVTPVRDMARLRDLLAQLADGLSAIHSAGMLHCDIKPSNVLVTHDGRVIILDFGIAQTINSSQKDMADRERARGTPTYMSPEQALGVSLTPATDSYAVGAMLYEALTGEIPFDGSAVAILLAKQKVLPPRPSELRIGIPEDLDELTMRLLAIDPLTRPSTTDVMTMFGHQTRSTRRRRAHDTGPQSLFEGRSRELGALLSATDHAAAGHAVVVHVSGPSGMGKSSLLSRFTEIVESRGDALVVRGRSYERESVPFKAFDSLVDGITRQLLRIAPAKLRELCPTNLEELALVFPVLRAVLEQLGQADPQPTEALAPHVLQRRAFEAFGQLIRNIGGQRQIVVVLDDLHWGDTDSARLLDHWVASGLPPLLLVLAYRKDPGARITLSRGGDMLSVLHRLRTEPPAELDSRLVELAELDEAEAFDVAFELLRARGKASAPMARAIASASGGHPFFLGELVEHAESAGPSRLGHPAVPTSVEEALKARIAALPEGSRQLLEVVCIARGPIDLEIAVRAAGTEHEADVVALRAARLATTFQHAGRTFIHTAHDRIREPVVAAIPEPIAIDYHVAIARALATQPDIDEAALAYHLIASGEHGRGREHALRAAVAAERSLAFLRAAELYRDVLALDGEAAAPSLHRRLADALSNGGRGAEAGRAYLVGARVAKARALAAERVDLLRLAAEHLLKAGRGDEGVSVLREVLSEVGLRYPDRTLDAAAGLLWRRTRLDASLLARLPRAAIRRAQVLPDRWAHEARSRSDVTYGTALGLSMFDILRGASLGYLNLEVALESGDPMRICRALCLASAQAAATGFAGRSRAERFLQAAHDISKEVSDAYTLALPRLADGNIRFFMGQWRAALGCFDEAEAVLRENCLGVHWETTTSRYQAINCLIFLGELKLATAKVGPVVTEALERSDEYALKNTIYPRAIAAIVAGAPDQARQPLERYTEHYSGGYTTGRWGALVASVTLDRYDGKHEAALGRMERDKEEMRRAMLFEVELIRVFTDYEHALCALAAAAGHDGERVAVAERLARGLLKEKPGYAIAMGHKVLGAVASIRGERARALDHMKQAIVGLERAGLRYIAACARYRRGQLSGSAGKEDLSMANAYFDAQGVASREACVAASYPGADA